MCLACAIPVRGRTFGAECLGDVLGEDAPPTPPPDAERPAASRTLTVVGFGVATVATFVSWSRFGAGSGPLGAWSTSFRWSAVCAASALAGLVLSLMRLRAAPSSRAVDVAATIVAFVVVATGALAIARPPAFTSPWLGPFVAIAGGALALVGGLRTLRGPLRRNAVTGV